MSPPSVQRPLVSRALLMGALWGVFLLVLVGLTTGCSRSTEPASQGDRPITLTFWTLQLLTFKDTLEPMFRAYEAEHPNVRIRWVDVPFSEGEKRTLTAIMSNTVPDVVNLNPDFSAVLASRRAVLNLNEWVSEEAQSRYLPVAWRAASLGEEAFGIPWYLTSSVSLYNQTLLEEAGFSAPPATYPELRRLGERLAEARKGYAVMPTLSESGNFLKELKRVGIPLYNESGQAVFADHGAAQHLQFWIDLYKNGWMPAESVTEGHRAAVDRYQAGTLAMLMTGPNFLNIVQENAPKIFAHTGVAPQFPTEARYADFSTMVLVVPRKSAHPQEAVDFALYMTNAANQMALVRQAPVLPSVTEALQDPYFQEPETQDLIARARGISARQLLAAQDTYQIRPGQHAINEVMNFYVQSALLGKLGAQTAMARAQAEINALVSAP